VKSIAPTKGVFIGVDGVVPMAKIRQQRMRRWKSIWTTEEEIRLGKRDSNTKVWDRNALTPGTTFMNKFCAELGEYAAANHWSYSSVTEPGEGEHKIMEQWRTGSYDAGATHVVYGMDADLILLTMYNSRHLPAKSSIYLVREDLEAPKDTPGFSYFNIGMLKNVIIEKYRRGSESAEAVLRDYVFAMTVLGNDFIPHGLSLSLKGDGYRRLEHFLKEKDRPLLVTEAETWNPPGLQYLFTYFAKIEPALIFEEIGSKEKARHARVLYGDDENAAWARGYSDWMRTPIKRMDEYALLKINKQTLAENWRDTYYYAWFGTKSGTQQNNTIVNT
jgi:5'-3' exonuclease